MITLLKYWRDRIEFWWEWKILGGIEVDNSDIENPLEN